MRRLFVFVIFLLMLVQASILLGEQFPITPHPQNRTDKRKCKIALCAVFQHEAPWLKEWIEYHRMIGVNHFYLYNNLSEDDYLSVLLPYIKAGIVELFDYPGTPFTPANQIVPYKHALKIAKKNSLWFGVIDIDEFIVMTQKNVNLFSFLETHFRKEVGVVLNWQCFGTSGVWDLQPGELLVEKLLMKAPVDHSNNYLFKSIGRTQHIQDIAGPHRFKYTSGHAVFADHSPVIRDRKPDKLPIDKIRIHHYFFRTEKFYFEVKVPRRELYGKKVKRSKAVHLDYIAEHNQISDPVMLQYASELKSRTAQPGIPTK